MNFLFFGHNSAPHYAFWTKFGGMKAVSLPDLSKTNFSRSNRRKTKICKPKFRKHQKKIHDYQILSVKEIILYSRFFRSSSTLHYVFSVPMVLYIVFMIFSLPKTLVKTLVKNLPKNLVKNLAKNLIKNLGRCQKSKKVAVSKARDKDTGDGGKSSPLPVPRFLARFLTKFLAGVLSRVLARGKGINTLYSTTRTKEKNKKNYRNAKKKIIIIIN